MVVCDDDCGVDLVECIYEEEYNNVGKFGLGVYDDGPCIGKDLNGLDSVFSDLFYD